MRAWTSATSDGRCSYEWKHHWKAGDRIFRLQGATWTKDFCGDCAMSRHGAPPDTGEILGLEAQATYPAPLKELAAQVGAELVSVADEPLFAEPFEEPPFDARMAQAGKDA